MIASSDCESIFEDERHPFFDQVDAAFLKRMKEMDRIFSRKKRPPKTFDSDFFKKATVLIGILHVPTCLLFFICANPVKEDDLFCLPSSPKIFAALLLLIASTMGVNGALKKRPIFVAIFLTLQIVIFIYSIIGFASVLPDLTKEGSPDWLLIMLCAALVILYFGSILLVLKHLRDSCKRPVIRHKTFSRKKTIQSGSVPMTPAVRVCNPSGRTELVIPSSPILPLLFDSVRCDGPDSMRYDESPTVFKAYKSSYLR